MTAFKIRFALIALLVALATACAPLTLGRKFGADPRTGIKVGFDQKADVLTKMGAPQRRGQDSDGREVFTYLWADGEGEGAKCLVAFNKNGIVYLVEVYP